MGTTGNNDAHLYIVRTVEMTRKFRSDLFSPLTKLSPCGFPLRTLPDSIRSTERWLSGRKRSPAKGVYPKRVSRVRIPPAPPGRHGLALKLARAFFRRSYLPLSSEESAQTRDLPALFPASGDILWNPGKRSSPVGIPGILQKASLQQKTCRKQRSHRSQAALHPTTPAQSPHSIR